MAAAEQVPLILNVDDFEAGRCAVTRVLQQASFAVREAATGAEALHIVATDHPDLVLLDTNLPDIDGFEVCRRIKADPATARIPVLHISASSVAPAERARGLEGGAEHHLTEPVDPDVLVATVRAVLRTRRSEDALRALVREWQATFDAIGDGVALLDTEGRIVRWNHRLEQLLGKPAEDIAGECCYRLWEPENEPAEGFAFHRAAERLRREEMDIRQGGRWFHVTVDPMLDDRTGALRGAVFLVMDTTARRNLEEQFRQAQKFESVGQLAAGVAHDFNNLLTSILGNTSLVLNDLAPGDPARERLEEVVKASSRAAHLTRQLLAYSGKGRLVLRKIDLSGALRAMESLLRSSVPKKVRLDLDLAAGLPLVEADPAQVQQVVLNLVINAAEAIGEATGEVRVVTGAGELAEAKGDLKPGPHVFLEVRDTGCGMDDHVRAHLFDPFFTTKFLGRGLGLPAVSGIVRGHKGAIEVQSAPGRGTTFRILFPAEAAARAAVLVRTGAARTVLVVDDEAMVRTLAKAALESSGYTVLLAGNGQEAVEVVRSHGERIGTVLLDMTMPVMGGEEALDEILALQPGIRVVASSGYGEREAVQRFGKRITGFLPKPYTAHELVVKIAGVLAAARTSTGAREPSGEGTPPTP